ncbi:MAG: glycogen/starch synthase, partial [Patescibacteria group bacterium]
TRANVFGYGDDHVRFNLLSKGCLEWLRLLKQHQESSKEEVWFPDIIHCNDWHTSYFIQLARQDRRYKDVLAQTPILLTVHNFHFQGNKDFRYLPAEEKDINKTELEPIFSDKLIHQNALLRGILNADLVNTVSPTHALEVLTPEYGEGLEVDLQNVRSKITGILNGIDTDEFNPATDTIIKRNYSAKTVSEVRNHNKRDLQKAFFLPEDINKVVIVISGRISSQKGWDLVIEVIPHILLYEKNLQIIILGDGDEGFKSKLQQLRVLFLDRIGLHLRGDFRLPRKLFAGGDITLMPSEFEPGGIVALEALRYGAVPLVRKTGGLADIVTDFDPRTGEGNGFSFKEKDPWVLFGKIVEAINIYKQQPLWKQLVQNCMTEDFSWHHAAKEYDRLYKKMVIEKKRAGSQVPHLAYKTLRS